MHTTTGEFTNENGVPTEISHFVADGSGMERKGHHVVTVRHCGQSWVTTLTPVEFKRLKTLLRKV